MSADINTVASTTITASNPVLQPIASSASEAHHTLQHPHARPLPALEPQPRWNLPRRIAFRFVFIYFILYSLPFPLQELPASLIFGEEVAAKWFGWIQSYDQLWQKIVTWVGKTLFAIDITVFPNGSGDTTFNYVQVLCFFAIASFGTFVWSAVDRKSGSHPRLHEWLRVYVRYVLALTMLGYGFAKVIQTQFPPPSAERLMQTYGSSSPMGLLWTFMGASTAYTFFAGFMECLGGVLLFPRRTVTLGAMVVSGVMLNVVLLNFCYDVPVKLYSSHLLLMAMWLTLPDLPALMSLLFRTKPVAPTPIQPLFRRRWMNRTVLALKILFVGSTLYFGFTSSHAMWKQMNDHSDDSPLAGVYLVESFTRGSVPAATSPASDDSRWKRVVINDFRQILVMAVQQTDDQMPRFRVTDDAEKKTMTIANRADLNKSSTLTYAMPEPGVLTLSGVFMDQPIEVRLRRTAKDESLLTTRGFRWINEFPFNR